VKPAKFGTKVRYFPLSDSKQGLFYQQEAVYHW